MQEPEDVCCVREVVFIFANTDLPTCWEISVPRTTNIPISIENVLFSHTRCVHLSVFCCTLCSLCVLCDLFSSIGGAIKPVVTFTPNWGNILYYDNVTLTCDVPSTVPEEPRTYQWYLDNQPIPGDQQRLHIIGSSVVKDSGDYQCQTIGGDISDPVFLNVTISYVLLQRPPSAIYEGDPLTLRCHHLKDFNSINTKFYKDDQEIKPSESDSTFHIPNITRSQSGRYKCTKQIQRIDKSNVNELSDESFISVKELFSPPEIKVPPSRVIEGDEMTLEDSGKYTCEVRTVSDTVRKMSDEIYIQIHELFSPPEIKVTLSRVIEGDNMTLEDSGKYTCEVRTRSDTVRKMSDGIYIQIYELFSPPEIKVTPSRVIEGDEMTVRCDTRLDPLRGGTELHFAFYRDGRTVRGYDVSDTYRVPSSQLEDSGKYTCEVRTASGTVRKMSDGLYVTVPTVLQDAEHNTARDLWLCIVCYRMFHLLPQQVVEKKKNFCESEDLNETSK
ncbi:Fc receptor-like B [Lithobates pipiens]